ncbi:LysR substrate-binding domain-containing protein [Burkholderia pseudomultivorans]|uniref:LysR substrate-binding domain-containing protein n=1 Tax=Burkholderia pseudomultivorans TaxID=1207504 RepID=UPI00188DCE16|nr:LysR substrate-binding domain-containing protein [Burkholderia pseudomultivorans]MBF5010131.1 LysR family transcriptional regulator [Burkholderia pseudomultivorans]
MDWTYRLRLRHLQVLLSVASTGNLSQSAAALATTQPALSKWLKELEEDVGLPLFERHARGLRPTPYGEALIEHARRVEAQLDIARDDMAALREGGSGLVTIGTSGVAAADTVPLAVSQLLKRMPRAQVRLTESTMVQLMPQLARGELDIVVGRSGSASVDPLLQVEALYVDPVVFVARRDHPLAEAASVGWDDVFAYPWIVWPAGTPVHNALEAALTAAGRTQPPHCVESNSSILNITLLNNTSLLGVASQRAATRFAQMNALRILPMQLEGQGAVSMYWHPDSENRAAVAAAIECLRACATPQAGDTAIPANARAD